jgi:hypothetical protein
MYFALPVILAALVAPALLAAERPVLETLEAVPTTVELTAVMKGGHVLAVAVTGRGAVPTLLTWRMGLGWNLEFEIRDRAGSIVPYRGPVAKPSRPELCDFRLLFDGQSFGQEFDLVRSDTFGLVAGRRYTVLVKYKNSDYYDWLTSADRLQLAKTYGHFDTLIGSLMAARFELVVR